MRHQPSTCCRLPHFLPSLREGASAGDLWKILVNPLFHPNSAQAADCNPLKVLIVEDDPVGLELLTEVLQSLEA